MEGRFRAIETRELDNERNKRREGDPCTWLRFRFGWLEVQADDDGVTSTISGSWYDELPAKSGSLQQGRHTVIETQGREEGGSRGKEEEGGERKKGSLGADDGVRGGRGRRRLLHGGQCRWRRTVPIPPGV
ncbi:hypothetical protein B296_00038284 [Ensete ventricosum]|uniref:Uncharacterized protein n=1 Tax=Ensete ventricosum TaxID=4639 RepID=A0A426YM35_ENSVE|nr:hypothetical protein B296_00038284 [Ensete ventricosum]